ncbi:hypothetical protein FA95DRAFT_1609265 [Auriscalpium vulgare]|uniref:Uncharacterized protein n=1 Tax=Auriscalpium vulgare TaxID=40419 RepID=A0ACB8RIW2_9AGAM|nr:hypothetical protein FA95DRAFT_1609265 [Auriscalpium vulgare]
MKFTSAFLSLALLVASAVGSPLRRDAAVTDTDILNFALTLEHLENAFYNEGLKKYTKADFVNAGLQDWVYGRIKQISSHEATHVTFLETALGSAAVQPCEYSFPYTDPKSFITISHALETVGTSAYTGAAKFIQNKDYLLAAATILSTEARQSAWVESAVRKGAAWSGPFETPLDLNQVFTLASGFITRCPESNPKLPVSAFPQLSVSNPKALPGDDISLSYIVPDGFDHSKPLFAAFLSGQNAYIVPLKDGKVKIPADLRGTSYVLVSTSADAVSDAATVAGPAMLDFPFNADNQPEQLPF